MPILCNESFSSSEVTRSETMRQRLILHMTNPDFCIVSSLLIRIQRVELDITFHNKTPVMEHFCVAMYLLEPQANFTFEPDIYILSSTIANTSLPLCSFANVFDA